MQVKFDAIESVPTAREREAVQKRAQERQERQSRSMAQRREQLLDVAQKLIETHGVEGLNMRQMARQAGYTAGALYAYFNGKEVILTALQRRVLDRLAQVAAGARVTKTPRSGRTPVPVEAVQPDAATSVAVARGAFVSRSLAWWGFLARDPESLQLLLLRAAPVPTPERGDRAGRVAELQGSSAGVAGLEDALDVCRQSLLAMGLQESVAYQLHRELLACGLGLLLLATASGHGQLEGMESQWTAALNRWLQSACAPDAVSEPTKGRQQNLFVA